MKLLITLITVLVSQAYVGAAYAGIVGGPKRGKDTVSAYSNDLYKFTFKGKEDAIVRVIGDGSTDLDCFVVDNKDNVILADINAGDTCTLVWVPAYTSKYKIVIRNLGKEDNEYVIGTN